MSQGLLLLVDDTINNLKVLSDSLTTHDYEVRCATSGELALQALEYIMPDLILLDIRMPGIDGFETCRRIVANPRTKDLPIIFISAMQETDERVRAFEVGGVDFVTKPFQEREVLARVSAHVNLNKARKQLQGLLQTTTNEYSAFQRRVEILFGLMHEAIGIFQKQDDGDYVLVECNPAFEAMVGSPKEIIILKSCSEIFRNNRKSFIAEIAEQLPTTPFLELPLQSFGFRKYYSTSATILAPQIVALVSTDVSDLVRSQEDLEFRSNEMESVVHVLSHDLRSPLLNIQGFRHELEDALKGIALNEIVLKSLSMIDTNSKKMDRLIRGLSMVARTGRRQLRMECVPMKDAIRNVIESNQGIWKCHGDYTIEQGDLPNCIGDKVQLEIAFGNIIGNAIQYRHPDRVPIIHVYGEIHDALTLYTISDNGRGITSLHQSRIWDLFYRGDSKDSSGEGLGLAVVRKIIDRLQGRTWLESDPCTGTKVFIELKSCN